MVGFWPGWSLWANLIRQNLRAAPVSGGMVIRLNFKGSGEINTPTDIQTGGTCNVQERCSYIGVAKLMVQPAS